MQGTPASWRRFALGPIHLCIRRPYQRKYSDPVIQHPKLVAFLFGCAVHRVSDEIIHWTFYPISKDKDFNGDYNQAHQYGDVGN